MPRHQSSRIGFAWLELLLVLAFLGLLFQVFPALWWGLWAALDVRTWSRTNWFVLNILVLLGLFGVRFGPDFYADWQKRQQRLASKRRPGIVAQADSAHGDLDYQARVRRDADWRERAKRRLPWQ